MILQSSNVLESFISSEAIAPSYEASQVVILPVPYEYTTTYRKGCKNGPAAILNASCQLEAYDEELEREICNQIGIYTHPTVADSCVDPDLAPELMLQQTERAVSKLIADNKFVITLGGEHSITAGVVKAYQKKYQEPFTVVQIDAHGDLRHQYLGSIYNHACVMRRILDLNLPILPVGIRSICIEEAKLIKERQIPVIWAKDLANDPDWIEKAIAAIKTPKVFITIDLDGIDPSSLPGVGTPEPGGLSWYAILKFLKTIFQTYEVIGCDVMELAPVQDSVVSQYTAAKLVYKSIGYHSISKT
ncbi:MAG: agmatinase [Prochloraceae cyanobacterium]